MQLIDHPVGDYSFLTGIAPYSSAVISKPGFVLHRAQFSTPMPLLDGFDSISSFLALQNRPLQSLCAMELRIPEPLTFDGFIEFNNRYREKLAEWDILVGNYNPVARTNVAPIIGAPQVPSIYAFSFTTETTSLLADPTFVVAGAGDLRDQADLSPSAIVRPGETNRTALIEKAQTVISVMTERLHGIQVDWQDVSIVNLYTPHSLDNFFEPVLVPKLGPRALHGVHWYYSRPPISGLEYEMCLRHVGNDIRLA